MEELIGKYAYKKRGFYGGVIGVVERSHNAAIPYCLRMKDGTGVGFRKEDEIVVVEIEQGVRL